MLIYNIVFTINVAFLLLTHFQGIFLCVTIWLLGISCKCVCVCLFVNIIYKMFKAALYPSLSTSISFLFEFHSPLSLSLSSSLSVYLFLTHCTRFLGGDATLVEQNNDNNITLLLIQNVDSKITG